VLGELELLLCLVFVVDYQDGHGFCIFFGRHSSPLYCFKGALVLCGVI